MQKNVHVVVGGGAWSPDSVKYRRHRLVDFLRNRSDTDRVFWVHWLSETLPKPLSYVHALSRLTNSLIEVDSSLVLYGLPAISLLASLRVDSLARVFSLAELKRQLASYPGRKTLWFTYPAFPFLAGVTDWDRIVYDCSDLWAASMGGRENFLLRLARRDFKKAEKSIADSSGVVFATSDFLAAHVKTDLGQRVVVVENGVDFELFRGNAQGYDDPMKEISRPRLGFVGGMKGKIDFPLLAEVADRNRNWSIVLIGPRMARENREVEELLTRANVHWLGGVEPEAVPRYMRSLDVGLLPYKEIDYNRAVFPLKLYEYLAVGLPVVGCGLPSTEKYVADGVYSHTRAEVGQFEGACREALSWSEDSEAKLARIDLAAKADWQRKFEFMLRAVLTSGEKTE